MEASVAAATGGQGEAAAEGQGQEQQGPDLSQFTDTLQNLTQGQEELRQFLGTQPWAQQEQQVDTTQQEPAAPDLSWLDIDSPTFDPEVAAQRMTDAFGQMAKQSMQPVLERINAVEEQRQEDLRVQAARDFVEEFPEVGDAQVAQQLVGHARQIAEANGHPDLAKEPWFWRQVYMAGRAADAANAEGQSGEQVAALEGGAGAMPGASEVDLGEQIVADRAGGRNALPFR
jgi:hypothetical protein